MRKQQLIYPKMNLQIHFPSKAMLQKLVFSVDLLIENKINHEPITSFVMIFDLF